MEFNPVLLNDGVTFQVLREDIVVPVDDVFWVRGATDLTQHPTGTNVTISGNSGGYNTIEKIGQRRFIKQKLKP